MEKLEAAEQQQREQQQRWSRRRARAGAEEEGEHERGDGGVTDDCAGWLWEGEHRDKRQRVKSDKRKQRPCAWCGVPARSVCGGCKAVRYCNRVHQACHWRSGHMHECTREHVWPTVD